MQVPAIVVSTGGSDNPVNSFPLSVGRSEGAAVAKSVSVGARSTTVAASFSANTKTNPSTSVHVAANVSNLVVYGSLNTNKDHSRLRRRRIKDQFISKNVYVLSGSRAKLKPITKNTWLYVVTLDQNTKCSDIMAVLNEVDENAVFSVGQITQSKSKKNKSFSKIDFRC
ncbi:hypothetical protein HHI36_012869 [Cryptolaemus montrouzieri]|uniref:Uncharacterized protein n=1 Tax=Cryptolaemus montrouzieri TaxID=559131 RepID=A0ABD2NG34_9CUCU